MVIASMESGRATLPPRFRGFTETASGTRPIGEEPARDLSCERGLERGGGPFGEDTQRDQGCSRSGGRSAPGPPGAPMISLDRPAWPRPSAAESDIQPLAKAPLETESSFYGRYAWCLDVFPTVRDVTRRLQDELSRQGEALKDWQRQEVALNAFMLSCAVADAVDDFTAGESFDFSPAAVLPGMRALTSAVERGLDAWRWYRAPGQADLRRWRAAWGAAQVEFLQAWLSDRDGESAALASRGTALPRLLYHDLPEALL